MQRLDQDNKDIAEFFIIYISEAHAVDSGWPVEYAQKLGIKQHKTTTQRCEVAERLLSEKKLTIPCLIDNMDNAVAKAYAAWPDRIYVIATDGRIAIAGDQGPWGYEPALKRATEWLKKQRERPVGRGATTKPTRAQRPPDRR